MGSKVSGCASILGNSRKTVVDTINLVKRPARLNIGYALRGVKKSPHGQRKQIGIDMSPIQIDIARSNIYLV
jgi:hypothetical protein